MKILNPHELLEEMEKENIEWKGNIYIKSKYCICCGATP